MLKKVIFFVLALSLAASYVSQAQEVLPPGSVQVLDNWDPDKLSKLSIAEYRKQNYPQAIGLATQALDIYVKNGNKNKEGDVLENLGIIYGEFSDYQRSIEYLLESVKIAEELNDEKALNSRYFNIGTTYIEVGDYRKGISFLNKSLDYFTLVPEKNVGYLIAGYTNIGVGYAGLELTDSAMINYQTALTYSYASEEKHSVGGTLLNIAELYNLQGEADTAMVYLEKSIDQFILINDVKGVWHARFEEAHSYVILGQTDKAIELLKEVISHYKKTNDLTYLEKSLSLISKAYEEKNDFERTNYYLQELIIIKDSISKAEIMSEMSKLELQYQIEKIHKESEARFNKMEREKRMSTLRWYAATIILIIVIILVFLLYSRKKIQKQLVETRLEKSNEEQKNLKFELEYKNKELENFALHIVQKTDFLREIKEELKSLKSDASIKNKERIIELNFKLNSSLRISNEIESFQNRVDEFYSKFFIILQEKYPDLTDKEKKLCALLRLNLSSKEIATLNGVTLGAITMARYRLRQKLEIENEDSFADFFNSLEN